MEDRPSLIVREFSLHDLRCHDQINWQCEPGINLLSGSNGSGKTTMLEAVYMMAHGRSFRQARDPELVRWGQSEFQISGVWKRYGPLNVQLKGRKGKSEIQLQGKKISQRRELSETLPVVVDAPQAGKLVDGVPGERRRWLDHVVHTSNPATFRYYQNYLRAVMQRSRLIRRSARGSGDAELAAWEFQIVNAGLEIIRFRNRVLENLNTLLADDIELMERPLHLEMKPSAPESEQLWIERLANRRSEDAKLGRLTIGPHCDRLKILFGGREIRSIGSRGQQKLAAMALKLAECALRLEHRHLAPLLLLDDCLEALDRERQLRLIRRLCTYQGQILMTVPNGIEIPESLEVHKSHLSMIKESGMHRVQPEKSGYKMEIAA